MVGQHTVYVTVCRSQPSSQPSEGQLVTTAAVPQSTSIRTKKESKVYISISIFSSNISLYIVAISMIMTCIICCSPYPPSLLLRVLEIQRVLELALVK